MGKIIAFMNNKGGQLKSTSTTNIAGILGKQGKKVLIVDTDPQGNSSIIFGKNPDTFTNTIYDVIFNTVNIHEVVIQLDHNISIIPCNSDMDYFEIDVLMDRKKFPEPYFLLGRVLEDVADYYDYVLIDCSPAMGLMAMNVLSYADEVVIPFVPDSLASRGIAKMYEKIEKFKISYNQEVRIGAIFPVMVEIRTNLHKDIISNVTDFAKSKNINMIDIAIPKSIIFSSEIAYSGKPAVWSMPNEKPVKAYFELVEALKKLNVL